MFNSIAVNGGSGIKYKIMFLDSTQALTGSNKVVTSEFPVIPLSFPASS